MEQFFIIHFNRDGSKFVSDFFDPLQIFSYCIVALFGVVKFHLKNIHDAEVISFPRSVKLLEHLFFLQLEIEPKEMDTYVHKCEQCLVLGNPELVFWIFYRF